MATIKESPGSVTVTGIQSDGIRFRKIYSQERYGKEYRKLAQDKYRELLFENSGLIRARSSQRELEIKRLTVNDVVEKYRVDHLEHTRADGNRTYLDRIKEKFGKWRLSILTIEAVRPWIWDLLNGGNYSPYSVRKVARYFIAALNFCCEIEMIDHNPLEHLINAVLKKEFARRCSGRNVDVDPKAFEQLIEKMPAYFSRALIMIWETGMRQGELGIARFSKIDGNILTLGVADTKEVHDKRIQLSATALQVIDEIRVEHVIEGNDSDLIFTRHTGEPWSNRQFSKVFRFWADKAGFKGLRAHDLRHAYRTRKWREGVPKEIIDAQLGHRSKAMPMVYTAIDKKDMEKLS